MFLKKLRPEKQELPEPPDLSTLRDLCSSCMHIDKWQRPTAEEIHYQLCKTWEPEHREEKLMQEALTEVRKCHPSLRFRMGLDELKLPDQELQQFSDDICQRASDLTTMLSRYCRTQSESYQTLHSIFQMCLLQVEVPVPEPRPEIPKFDSMSGKIIRTSL